MGRVRATVRARVRGSGSDLGSGSGSDLGSGLDSHPGSNICFFFGEMSEYVYESDQSGCLK